jgi:hypothetical protein
MRPAVSALTCLYGEHRRPTVSQSSSKVASYVLTRTAMSCRKIHYDPGKSASPLQQHAHRASAARQQCTQQFDEQVDSGRHRCRWIESSRLATDMYCTSRSKSNAPTKSRSAAAELIGTWQVIAGAFASPMYSCPSRVAPLVDGDSAASGTVSGGTPSAIAA